jgi:dienelactone hydrolase
MTRRVTVILLAGLGCGGFAAARAAGEAATAPSPGPPHAPACAPATLVTLEHGRIAAVDWVEPTPDGVRTRSVEAQSLILEARLTLRADATAARSSATVTAAGGAPSDPRDTTFDEGAIYWSDALPSAVEQAVLRARLLDRPVARIPAASPFSPSHGEVVVERLDATDWVVDYHAKRYEVLTDANGCLLAATLPETGVVIERRPPMAPSEYTLWVPNAPPPDGAYDAADVVIPAPQGHALAGTLTRPPGRGRLPAAVLITGLSANDRNNGSPPWMPLRDVADALTRAGIVVLRVDDRGVGKSTGERDPSTTFDEADDVRTEVAWLRARPGIDPRRIALVGYSEGALIAPMVASRDPAIAVIVSLDGTGVSGAELARYQIEQAVRGDPSIAEADRDREIERQLAEPLTPREKSLLSIDPIAVASAVRCPALIVHGGSDRHVPPRSAERLAAAMRAGGNRDVTVRLFPGVSHSMLPDPIGLSAGWVTLPAFLTDPGLLEAVSTWTAAHLRSPKNSAR